MRQLTKLSHFSIIHVDIAKENKTLDKQFEHYEKNEPWKNSGFNGSGEQWVRMRKPIIDLIDSTNSSFLDVGCANGYLLECAMKWCLEREIDITPYGIDIVEQMVVAAKSRLQQFKSNIFLSNIHNWFPDFRFDYVRTPLSYASEDKKVDFIDHLFNNIMKPNGTLLLVEYFSFRTPYLFDQLSSFVSQQELNVIDKKSIFDLSGREVTRLYVIKGR